LQRYCSSNLQLEDIQLFVQAISTNPNVRCMQCKEKRAPSDIRNRRTICGRCRLSRPRQPGPNRRLPQRLPAIPLQLSDDLAAPYALQLPLPLPLPSSRSLQLVNVNMPHDHRPLRMRPPAPRLQKDQKSDSKNGGKRSGARSGMWEAMIAVGLETPTIRDAALLLSTPSAGLVIFLTQST